MKLIWATRGRTWGFRFLEDGGLSDPLPQYDAVFSGLADEAEICRHVGNKVALRFPDPLGRKDSAGRIIPHEFVVFPPLADRIHSIEDGRELVWALPQISEKYERVWQLPKPSPAKS